MKYLTILLMLFSLECQAEDYFFIEITQNVNLHYVPIAGRSNSWIGDYPLSERIGYHKDFKNNFYASAQFEHGSSLFLGKPFNDKEETTFNWIGTTIGWKF